MEGSPSFRPSTRKSWIAVSMIELVIILILAAGLAHFATHPDRDLESWPDSSMLASLDRVNRTLQVATKRWESCQNQMRLLEANTSLLSSEMAQLNARLQLQELENRGLEDELTLLRNWTQLLQDLNNQQKALIGHFRYQQERLASHGRNLRLHSSLASLVLALMVAHWV